MNSGKGGEVGEAGRARRLAGAAVRGMAMNRLECRKGPFAFILIEEEYIQ
jgi:hypothetical protein